MKKIIALFLSLCCLAFSQVSCKKEDEGLKTIRLNEVTHSIFYAPLYVAIENDFFSKEGIKIELTNGGGADKSMTDILSGGADIGLMGVEAAIYVLNEGKTDYPVVFGQLTKRDGSFLVSRKNEVDFKWENLQNKTIISGRTGGVPCMTLEYVLNGCGLYDGVNVTMEKNVAFNLMGPSFEGGLGDYVTLFEPTASEYQKAGKGYIVASVGEKSGEIPYTAFMALRSYVDKNQEVIEKFLTALQRAIKYIQEEDETVVAKTIAKQFPSTSVESIAQSLKSYKKIDAWTTNMSMTKTAFDNLQTVMKNADELEKEADYGKIAYNELAQKAYEKIFG